jgi:GNAT superfamily N-acetyltransferase
VEAIIIRNAILSEKAALEDLQLRASLTNEGDREALLANPDAIDLPIGQIASGDVFVPELSGCIAGFAALQPRPDGDAELDGLFVEPDIRRRGVGRSLIEPHAEQFYLSCGFNPFGLTETRFGPAQLMRRHLLP